MITTSILKDSTNPYGERVTTFLCTYPKMIHAEFMTYRMFSRNAASSRAIPISKMIQAVHDNCATPEFWAKNQAGMAAVEQLEGHDKTKAELLWAKASSAATSYAQALADMGLHKALANRVIEPFSHITVVMTSSEMGLMNMFAQRCHKDAQQEFQVLAYRMLEAFVRSTPTMLGWGGWHLPFVDNDELDRYVDASLINSHIRQLHERSVARCARVSYLNHDSTKPTAQDDQVLYERLKTSGHWSPFEHQLRASSDHYQKDAGGNIDGRWVQLRRELEPARRPLGPTELATLLESRPAWVTL